MSVRSYEWNDKIPMLVLIIQLLRIFINIWKVWYQSSIFYNFSLSIYPFLRADKIQLSDLKVQFSVLLFCWKVIKPDTYIYYIVSVCPYYFPFVRLEMVCFVFRQHLLSYFRNSFFLVEILDTKYLFFNFLCPFVYMLFFRRCVSTFDGTI